MTVKEIAEEHEVSRVSIHTYRRRGTFPQPVEGEGSTRLRFRADEVAAFFAANPKQPGKRTDLAPEPDLGEPVTTTTDPRIAILSSLNDPPYNETAEKRCVPWDEAEKMLDAYRSKEWRLAAESIEQEFLRGPVESERDEIWNDAIRAAATVLRQEAKGPEAQDG
jgi:predicted DNA-binding transcriptional regulator AlpA